MENLNKAINMGVNAILFIIAISIAFSSYVNIMVFLDSVLQTSDRHAHDVENQVLESACIYDTDILYNRYL